MTTLLALLVNVGLAAAPEPHKPVRPAFGNRPRPTAPKEPGSEGGRRTTTPGRSPGMQLATGAMHGRSLNAAIRMYEAQVAKAPDAPAPAVALGRAYARAGRCDDALDQLWPWIGTTPFGENAALSASICSARLGLHDDAVYFDHLALEDNPDSARIYTQLAMDSLAAGDLPEMWRALDWLAYEHPDGEDHSLYAEAVLAIRGGDIDAFDAAAFQWHREGRDDDEMTRLKAQVWLDLDDPVAALSTLADVRQNANIRPLRADATRRLGAAEEALLFLDSGVRSRATGVNADATRARTLADLGRLPEAEAALEDWVDSDDPDALSAWWYVARAKGDTAAMRRWAHRYAVARQSPLRTLEQLIPVTQRS